MQTSIYFSLSLHNHDNHRKWLRLVISFIAELRASRATFGDEALFQSLEVSVF